MAPGIILVHGYSGSHHDLEPLDAALAARFGTDCVTNLTLPGHDTLAAQIPEFDDTLFCAAIFAAVSRYQKEHRRLVLIGHSTGGNLILAALQRYAINPALLILMAAPLQIDRDYFTRWEAHRSGKSHIPLTDVALMVKLINATGSQPLRTGVPVLILHGENDQLVLVTAAHDWKLGNSARTVRVVTISEAGHNLLRSKNSPMVCDLIGRAIADMVSGAPQESPTLPALLAVEPGLQAFLAAVPGSFQHLALCPGAQRVLGKSPELLPTAPNDPVLANIEITTYCNLQCQFCARTQLHKSNRHMPFALFRNILACLPNLYQIVLVGLGEPLCHPQIMDFISYAKSLNKKVGMVTNAMLLTPEVSRRLLETGLDSISFSLDGADHDLATLVRAGTDFDRVIRNIRKFVKLAQTAAVPLSKAVFSAVSCDTVAHLDDLVDCVAALGVDVLMLTDINFKGNLEHTLWQNQNEELEALVKQAISRAFAQKLPVLSVHGLEEFGLKQRYHDFLMIPPGQLYQRSATHTWCLSPWQTVPIDVAGNITFCDCQPTFTVGNLFQESFTDIWNGEVMRKYRAAMLSSQPPEACQICPRF
jgi:MoaA/NifB/PqqE/SkfB family radical SAM enzyme/alpha-beta hydrolase superfamily lysophospholipase